jgi:hypothetical protein
MRNTDDPSAFTCARRLWETPMAKRILLFVGIDVVLIFILAIPYTTILP